ncbi:MAG: sugar-binding domain-containing protein, partial [Rudaea sp.]
MTRIRMNLDGMWDFFVDPQQRLRVGQLDQDGQPRQIKVPGPWQAQFQDLRQYTGVAWYRKRFSLSSRAAAHPPSETTFVLHFGAVDYFATVWLNGVQIGEHEGGYLPFELVLNSALRIEGENELVIRVIDPGDDVDAFSEYPFTEIPHGKQSWYGPVGGIWQSVYVEARHTVHITRLHITPDVPNE